MKKSADAMLVENLRREMAKRHLSEADLAHRSGLSVSTIKTLLTADEERESVNLSRVQRCADALGVAVAQLLAEPDAPAARTTRAPSRANDDTPKQLSQLIEEFFALPEADRRVLVSHAADMASKYRMQVR